MIIKLPDGSERAYDGPKSVKEITMDISEGLARAAVGAVVNGEILGMNDIVSEDSEVKIVKFEDKEGKRIFWHTTSHVMAYAISNLYKDVKFAIGPSTDNGFYYDIDTEYRFAPEDLEKIEAEMEKILTPDQFKKFQALKEKKMAERKEHFQKRKAANTAVLK